MQLPNFKGVVIGIALRKNNKFATNFEVVPNSGWYRAKASWYSFVCNKGREYEENQIAYVIKFKNKLSLMIETPEMFEASLEIDESSSESEPLQSLLSKEISKEISKSRSKESQVFILPTVIEGPFNYVVEELAPGLFMRLKALISGQILYCGICNLSMAIPAYKSIHGKQKVMFCSADCFNKYNFVS